MLRERRVPLWGGHAGDGRHTARHLNAGWRVAVGAAYRPIPGRVPPRALSSAGTPSVGQTRLRSAGAGAIHTLAFRRISLRQWVHRPAGRRLPEPAPFLTRCSSSPKQAVR